MTRTGPVLSRPAPTKTPPPASPPSEPGMSGWGSSTSYKHVGWRSKHFGFNVSTLLSFTDSELDRSFWLDLSKSGTDTCNLPAQNSDVCDGVLHWNRVS